MLIRRRKLFDQRLRNANISKWPIREYWNTPDAVILEAIDAYRDLKSGVADENQIWGKLDSWFNFHGPSGAGVSEYVRTRMPLFDPKFCALGDKVLSGHIDMCSRWLEKVKPLTGTGWLARDSLRQPITFAEFEGRYGKKRPIRHANSAALVLSRYEQDLARFWVRILPGDEVWTFSTPAESWRRLGGRAGLALVRSGRIIALAVTAMN
jgi:hypothetical protein